jgi:hypothetical protein
MLIRFTNLLTSFNYTEALQLQEFLSLKGIYAYKQHNQLITTTA